jgi:tripartite-type tricarboxylate transporter receptor subunit TctC
MMKAYLKIADELISMDSKKLTTPPSSNQQGTLRVSDATMIATSRNTPSTLVISSSAAYRTQKDYTSSARHGKVPFTVAKVTGPGSYRLQTLEGEDVNNSWNIDQLCRFYT